MPARKAASAKPSLRSPPPSGEHYMLGVALEQQGRWPEAVTAFEQELALDPDQPKVRAELDAAQSSAKKNAASKPK